MYRKATAAEGRAARSTRRRYLHPEVILLWSDRCMCHDCLGHAGLGMTLTVGPAPVTDVLAAPLATGTPLQDSSNLICLTSKAAQPDAAEVARKAHRAQHQREVRAAMTEQQAAAVRAADASAHNKSMSVKHKVSPAVAGYSALSMTVMTALFSSSSAAAVAQPPQQPIEPQPSATTASDLIPTTTSPQAPALTCTLAS